MEDTEDYIKSHLHKERGTVEADRVALRGEVQRIQVKTVTTTTEATTTVTTTTLEKKL